MRSRSLIVALALGTLSSRLQAQETLTQPTAIPFDLALALTGSGGLGSDAEPQILVGSIPGWAMNRLLLPNEWRPLGSAFLGTTVIGVVQIPTANDSLIKQVQLHFQRVGWRNPPAEPGYGGGFRPAPTTAARAARRFTACRETQFLSAWIAREQPLSTIVAFRLSSPQAGQFNQCNPRPLDPRMAASIRENPFPTLYDPVPRDGATMMTCYNPSDSYAPSIDTRYKSTMTAEQLLDHYGRQLADSGWMLSPPRPQVIRTWTRPDSTGGPRTLTLSVTRPIVSDTGCVRVMMEVRDRRP